MLYRVFDLPEELRARLRAKRAKAAATTAEVVQTATADCLPKLVTALRELGFRADGTTRPALVCHGQHRNTRCDTRDVGKRRADVLGLATNCPHPRPLSRTRARGAFFNRPHRGPLPAGEGTFCKSGWERIRTPGGLSPTAVFKTAALDHSATHPKLFHLER